MKARPLPQLQNAVKALFKFISLTYIHIVYLLHTRQHVTSIVYVQTGQLYGQLPHT